MELTKNNIINILKEVDFSPSKNKGQNFLCEPETAKKIVSFLGVEKDENVLEVGPGLGSLTIHIPDCANIDAVDVDKDICDIFSFLHKDKEIHIICENIFNHAIGGYNKIISNMPYSITSELLEYLLLNFKKCTRFVLMSQDEAFYRFSATSGKDYGPINVLIQLLGAIQRKATVKANAFYPQPKCHSIVFQIDINPKYDIDTCRKIYTLSRSLFLNRRKTILNNMLNIIDKDTALKILSENKVPLTARTEQLSVEQFANIFFSLKNR